MRQIDQMIDAADVVMIARGDLGIECPMEELPIIQRKIVKRCLRIGKPVIVATHMLESMIENPVPTRAEITDVANAVFEQADAIMLSGETSMGRYPVECVKVFDRVARRIERSGGAGYGKDAFLEDDAPEDVRVSRRPGQFAGAREARGLHPSRDDGALRFESAAGKRADLCLHSERGSLSPDRHLLGNASGHARFADDPNVTIEAAIKYLREARLTEPGDNLVILSDMLGGRDKVDCVQLRMAE